MIKRRKKPKNIYNLLIGEYITVVLDVIETESIQTDETVREISSPAKAEGFLIDIVDDYYIMGGNPQTAEVFIPKDKVLLIKLTEKQHASTVYDDLLDSLPVNPRREDVN
jgi:hypothetical protein